MNIYPTILTDELSVVEEQLTLCEESGLVETVQIDVIDGYFIDNVTIAPGSLYNMNFGEMELDFHLMTQEPIDFVYEIADYKDDLPIRAVIAQVEQMSNQELFVDEVRRNNWKIGLSLNLHTPLSAIDDGIWERIQVIQLMSVEAGSQGQKLNEYIYEKIDELQEMIIEKDLKIELIVDGGVTKDNIVKLQEHGVTSVGVGSILWKSNDFALTHQELEGELL